MHTAGKDDPEPEVMVQECLALKGYESDLNLN